MQTREQIEIGHTDEASRWLRISLNVDGGCSIALVDEGGENGLQFPCSLETLRMVAHGMSYQASSPDGYITVTSIRDCLHFSARQSGDRSSWVYQMPVQEFVKGLTPLGDEALGRRRGYVA